MMFERRRWVILTAEEAEDIDFSKVIERSADRLCWNNDNTKTFVKYRVGSKPSFLRGKAALNFSQIHVELAKDEWRAEE